MATHPREPRRRSIRVMLAPLFIVTLVSLLALWAFAASVILINAIREHNYNTQNQHYGAAAQALGLTLAQERSQTYVWLSSGRKTPVAQLTKQREATNAAVRSFEHGVRARPALIPASARPAMSRFIAELGTLNKIRSQIDARQLSALKAFQDYDAIIDGQFPVYGALVAVNDSALYRQGIASLQAGRALEMLDREVTLVNGALASGGRMNHSERLQFVQDVANQRLLIADALQAMWPDLAAAYRNAYTSPAYRQFSAIEDRIMGSVGHGGPVPVASAQWSVASFSMLGVFEKAEQKDRMILARAGTRVGDRLLQEVLLAAGLGLIAVVLSVYLMARFWRRISRELTGLQRSALDLATERLPQVVQQLSRGEDVDQAALAAPAPPGRIAEVARVAEAFMSVQQTAVDAAAGQARLRRGVSQVFRNLAWRSQALLHRQLDLLDAMERSTQDPGTLEELFQLDHLTTRMRRHAEGLIILSGEAPGRGWRKPVPVVDVLRAAIAEVEDYTRVSVITRSTDALSGTAVADVIHLLAELVENATTNSPRNTEVTVRAERVVHGIVVEVEDRGLGMSDEELAAANARFADPPEFDLADSDKLGFFVIARLASRHHIKITLRPSPYGGLAAIVLLPNEIAVTDDSDLALESTFVDRLELPPAEWLEGSPAREVVGWGNGDRAIGSGADVASSSSASYAADPDGAGAVTDVLSLGQGPVLPPAQDRRDAVTAWRAYQDMASRVQADELEAADFEPSAAAAASSEQREPEPTPASASASASAEDLLGLPRRIRGTDIPAEPPAEEPSPSIGPSGLPQRQSQAQREGIPRREGPLRRGALPVREASVSESEQEKPDQEPSQGASPEELGSLASSLQRGWLNGRSEADQSAGS